MMLRLLFEITICDLKESHSSLVKRNAEKWFTLQPLNVRWRTLCLPVAIRNKTGVTDDALWTVFDALLKAANGDKKYLRLSEDGVWSCRQDIFDNFQEIIANWDAEYATQ